MRDFLWLTQWFTGKFQPNANYVPGPLGLNFTLKFTRKSALGGKADNLDTDTTIPGISGVGSVQSGSKMSESQQISDELKDPDWDYWTKFLQQLVV